MPIYEDSIWDEIPAGYRARAELPTIDDTLDMEINVRPELKFLPRSVVTPVILLNQSSVGVPARQNLGPLVFTAVSSNQFSASIQPIDGQTGAFLMCDITAYSGTGNVLCILEGSQDNVIFDQIARVTEVFTGVAVSNSQKSGWTSNAPVPGQVLPRYVRIRMTIPGTATVTGQAWLSLGAGQVG